MATTSSSTTKAKGDSQNLTRSKSNICRKPKLPSSVSSEEGSSDPKPEKPLPNYLKPTISSRSDPVKFVKKSNNSVEDNQKLLRRRSFDRPPSSLTSPSTSSTRNPKSLNVSPSQSGDKTAVPREKPATTLRSSSFHGTRSVPRGGTTGKSPPVAPKKSGLSSSSSSLKSRKEGSTIKKASEKEIPLDTASLSSAQEDEEEVIKVESDHHEHVAENIEEPKDEKEPKEVQVEVVEAVESGKEVESVEPLPVVSPLVEDCIVIVAAKEDEKVEEMINIEAKAEEKIEETKEQEINQDIKDDKEEEIKESINEVETPEKVDIEKKEVESVEETTEEKVEEVKEENKKVDEVKEEKEVQEENEKVEEVKEEKEVQTEKEKENEKEEVKEELREEKEKEMVKEEEKEKAKEEEKKRREVVKGKKESPSAYNDVIASKMQGNPRKNKVLALAGAFQTVIDYETAASK